MGKKSDNKKVSKIDTVDIESVDKKTKELSNEDLIKKRMKARKKAVYGTYKEDRRSPRYQLTDDFKMGLTDEEVEERIDNHQVNIEGKIESPVKKNLKLVLKVILKNSFTFFNVLYLIVFVLLIIADLWNRNASVNEQAKNLLNLNGEFTFSAATFTFVIIVLFNLIIGIIQESRSKIAISNLQLVTNPKVTLIRNGEKVVKYENDVVLDDVVYLTPGVQIVADMVVLEGEIEVNESQLTGESVPIKKRVGEMVYSGSFMVSGTSYAKVIHVAKMNEINKLTSQAKKYTEPNSQILSGLKKLLVVMGFLIVLTSLGMFAWSWNWADFQSFVSSKFTDGEIASYLKANYVVAIKPITAAIIGMIPAGLYLLTSVALSVGVFRLSKCNTLVQDIYCIETLARVNVLCLDKTGTITNGKMTVVNHEVINKVPNFSIDDIMCSMNAALQETNATAKALENYYGIKSILIPSEVIPFSSDRKFSAVTFGYNGTYILGAPEFILKGNYDKYADSITEYANKGLRVICLAHSSYPIKDGKITRMPKPIALILIKDQIREEAPQTIEYFKNSGVEVKVISGDNPITVSEVAKRVGIENAEKCISLDGMSEDEVRDAASKFTVFGRVKPDQKKILVEELKRQGKTVAMTGDGVNDIPALKAADCSIAMASGNDSVKSVAQLVLVDSNFASMPKVVAEGRRVINNVQQTAMLYLVKTLFMTFLAILTASGFFYLLGSKESESVFLNFIRNASFPFSGSNQLMIMEMFAIGLPSVILALQSNNAPVKGNFMKNALKRAIPGTAGVVCAIILTYWLSKDYGFQVSEVKTVVALTATLTLLAVMVCACVPVNKKKIVLCVAMFIVSGICLITSMKGKTIGIPNTPIQLDFEFDELTWQTVRIVKKDGQPTDINSIEVSENGYIVDSSLYKLEKSSNATAAWLTFSMVVVSISMMLGVELLIKNIENNKENGNSKKKEKDKLKSLFKVKKIKY